MSVYIMYTLDNGLSKEDDLRRVSSSSCYPSILGKTIRISVKDVGVYDCIQIIKSLNRYFDLSIVLMKKKEGIS